MSCGVVRRQGSSPGLWQGHWEDGAVTLIWGHRRRKENKEFGLDNLRLERGWEYQTVTTGDKGRGHWRQSLELGGDNLSPELRLSLYLGSGFST